MNTLKSLDQVVGQRLVVEQVKVALQAAKNDGTKFDHAMLVGGPGLGKTQTSQLIGQEMADGYLEVLGQSLSSTDQLNPTLLSLTSRGKRPVLFIDEAHELPREVQTALYLALDQGRIVLQGRNNTRPIRIPIGCDFTVLLATTHEFQLLAPLRDRMKLVLRFQYYSSTELEHICKGRADSMGWEVETMDLFPSIANRSRGTPRLALRLLQSAYRCTRGRNGKTISIQDLVLACELDGIDGDGLGELDRQYLLILAEAPTPVNVAASRLGIQGKTISDCIEPYLLRTCLIFKDESSKRNLTQKGRDLVESHQNA